MVKPLIKGLDLGPPRALLAGCKLIAGESLIDSGANEEAEYSEIDALLLCPESTLCIESHEGNAQEIKVIQELEEFASRPWYYLKNQVISEEAWQKTQRELGSSIPLILCSLSYELGAQAHGIRTQETPHSAPALWATRYRSVYIWQRKQKKGYLVASDQEAYKLSLGRLIRAHSNEQTVQSNLQTVEQEVTSSFNPECSFEQYKEGFTRLQEAILDGEVYQMNYTIALKKQQKERYEPVNVFQKIWPVNSGQFSSLILLDDNRSILSFSPERLAKWSYSNSETAWIETAPIKGTRPRRAEKAADQKELNDLKSSIKDQAEHVMILDLERNDLGQICKSGSIQVTQDRVARTYATVHHLVSVVRGELLDGVKLNDILKAVYPGGSVTGAPKKRAMDLIRELELSPRGIYCGALGYLDPLGGGDLNLPIRTIYIDQQQMEYHSGGGVVADSSAEGEWSELWVKTKGFEKALLTKYDQSS